MAVGEGKKIDGICAERHDCANESPKITTIPRNSRLTGNGIDRATAVTGKTIPRMVDRSLYDLNYNATAKTTMREVTIHAKNDSLSERSSRPLVRVAAGYTLRTLLLDLPVVITLLTYASLLWMKHVLTLYLDPQLDDMVVTEQRKIEENTYYMRECNDSDIPTTTNASDLFLPEGATPEDAYQHQLKHGFTVFRNILSEETATNLRNFVVSRNRNLTDEESIFVIEGSNRFSFPLGIEEPSVRTAAKELAKNKRLRNALEKILGPSPALIEMTAITSSYGAIEQYWHDDVIAASSAITYGRTYAPPYSVFIQLQNTTKEMGATAACPGTHYCSEGDDTCDTKGFQLVDEDGYWRAGDALLMNQNSWHRGAAHTDPDAPDRVMLILTFAPKPTDRAETRVMSQGITFSLRWDLWGHTLYDLANADTAMTQPWATLRSLGLYKPADADWGIDYISGTSMRIANQDIGFRREDLDKFLEQGGIKWLPGFLQGHVEDDESWYEFCIRTFMLCEAFIKAVCLCAVLGYIAVFLVLSLWSGKKSRLARFGGAIVRLAFMASIVYLFLEAAKRHVDRTDWANDVRAHRRYASTVENEIMLASRPIKTRWSTFPTRFDVLVETRYGSEQLAMYNDFVAGHPGNRLFRRLVDAGATTYSHYPHLFQEASAKFIVSAIALDMGRFLYQGPNGLWYRMDDNEDAIVYTKRELTIASSTLLEEMRKQIRFMVSDYKYGVLRGTALAVNHASAFLVDLEKKLLREPKVAVGKISYPVYMPKKSRPALSPATSNARRVPRRKGISPSLPVKQPSDSVWLAEVDLAKAWEGVKKPWDGAWLEEGEMAEAWHEEYWYLGSIRFVKANGDYGMSYFRDWNPAEETTINPTTGEHYIRNAQPYKVGEKLEVLYEDDEEYYPCEIIEIMEDDTYRIFFYLDEVEEDSYLEGVEDWQFRRHDPIEDVD